MVATGAFAASDRSKWGLLLKEFHYIQIMSVKTPNDYANTWEVPFKFLARHMAMHTY